MPPGGATIGGTDGCMPPGGGTDGCMPPGGAPDAGVPDAGVPVGGTGGMPVGAVPVGGMPPNGGSLGLPVTEPVFVSKGLLALPLFFIFLANSSFSNIVFILKF